jgi:hypothetical protein
MIVNEWQLNSQINTALQREQRADFSLYLALLSPAVEEFAQFYTPEAGSEVVNKDLYRQLGVSAARSFALDNNDIAILNRHSQALQRGGLLQLKLAASLNSAPLALYDDKKRLHNDVWQNLSLHSRRRVSLQSMVRPEAQPAALYEVLQQLHGAETA